MQMSANKRPLIDKVNLMSSLPNTHTHIRLQHIQRLHACMCIRVMDRHTQHQCHKFKVVEGGVIQEVEPTMIEPTTFISSHLCGAQPHHPTRDVQNIIRKMCATVVC